MAGWKIAPSLLPKFWDRWHGQDVPFVDADIEKAYHMWRVHIDALANEIKLKLNAGDSL
jgi:hypothetical protein